MFCIRVALNVDEEDEDLDAEDQLRALKEVRSVMAKGSGGSLAGAISQKGFKRMLEQSDEVAKSRSKAQSKRSKFPKLVSKASAMLDTMQTHPEVPDNCDQSFKLIMSAARDDKFEGSISQGEACKANTNDMLFCELY